MDKEVKRACIWLVIMIIAFIGGFYSGFKFACELGYYKSNGNIQKDHHCCCQQGGLKIKSN